MGQGVRCQRIEPANGGVILPFRSIRGASSTKSGERPTRGRRALTRGVRCFVRRWRCRAGACDGDSLDLQAALIHIEPLFPIQFFHEFARGFCYRAGQARRVDLDRRSVGTVVAILISK